MAMILVLCCRKVSHDMGCPLNSSCCGQSGEISACISFDYCQRIGMIGANSKEKGKM
jgi:hypothetical protein